MASYSVKQGDTLGAIAKANNTTVDAIAKANSIADPNRINVGASLNIPGLPSSTPPGASSSPFKFNVNPASIGTISPTANSTPAFVAPKPAPVVSPLGAGSTVPTQIPALQAQNSPASVTTPQPTAQPAVVTPPPYTPNSSLTSNVQMQNEITSMQKAQRANNAVSTQVPNNLPSGSLNPSNTRSSLMSTAQTLQDKLLGAINGTPESTAAKEALAKVRNEQTDAKIAYDKTRKEIEANASGQLAGAVAERLSKLDADFKNDTATRATREANALGQVKLYQDDQTQVYNQIKLIKDLTNEDMVGSLMTDKTTGQVLGFFKNPTTGEVSQRVVGNVSPEGGGLLSVQEAAALGVPYGTRASEAYGKNPVSNVVTDNERAAFTQFRSEPIVKNYNEVIAQKLYVDNLIKNGVGGPADLALVYSFMKGLDPTSVVREAEFDAAANSGNIFAGAFAKYNGYLKPNGGFLPENVQKQFQNLVNEKVKAQQVLYDNTAKIYREQAKRQGLNPDNVVLDYNGALGSNNNGTPAAGTVVQTAAGAIPTDW